MTPTERRPFNMFRNDWYGIYQGKKYEINGGRQSGYIIRSYENEEGRPGFRKVMNGSKKINGSYVKNVLPEEIENPVSISTYATYKEVDFPVIVETGNQIRLFAGKNVIAAREYGFEQDSPGEWCKWIDKNDPDLEKIFEETTPITL